MSVDPPDPEPPAGPARSAADPARSTADPAPSAAADLETDWRRLDPRMLLIHPVQEAIRFLPALLGVFLLGRSRNGGAGHWWELLSVAVVIGVGVMRYLTTRFRIRHGQIELRKGLINRQVIATPEDRVRTVDLTAPPFHRLLGLAKVEIGTAGHTRERLVLDALPLAAARTMREELIHLRSAAVDHPLDHAVERADRAVDHAVDRQGTELPPPTGLPRHEIPPPVSAPVPVAETTLLTLNPAWVRYAPLTMSGLVTALAVFGFTSQFLRSAIEGAYVQDAVRALGGHAWWVSLLVGLASVAVAVSFLAVLGYILQNWHFRLSRHQGGTLHVSRGLLTTRETSIEEKRLRGVEVGEPLGLRLAGGSRLKAITTGLSRREDDRGSAWLVPPAPRSVVAGAARAVVGDDEALTAPLTPHGPAARHRRYLRTLVPAVVLAVGAAAVVWWLGLAWWLLVLPALVILGAPFLARDRYAGLGHHLSPDHLVVRSGSFSRRRDVLQRTGIIGWTVQSTWFQRRVGLATLVATTAAGKQRYTAYDLPVAQAVAVAHEVDPALLEQFLAR